MENSTVTGLRSRSRSKTPFLRSSCDRENCTGEGEDHLHHKTGRKTPVKRNTPNKQLYSASGRHTAGQIIVEEEPKSLPAHRTRQSVRTTTDKLIKTSDYSSEESPDRLKVHRKDASQNNYEFERVSSSSSTQRAYGGAGAGADITLSPILPGESYTHYTRSYNVSGDRSRFSPTYSGCSTDSSFAEQALADVSTLVERDPHHSLEHLPYRLYKVAGEYWNKYPKTDFTYSPLSKDRVELAPGQVAVPNMSRRSLSQFRITGPSTSADELDHLMKQHNAWTTSALRKRTTTAESSDDEVSYGRNGGYTIAEKRWWITQVMLSIITTITTTTSSLYRNLVGPSHRYPYTDRQGKSVLRRSASALAAPFYWIYTVITQVITTTVTTITETVTPNHVGNYNTYGSPGERRGRWPWLLLLLLPFIGYGCYHYGGNEFGFEEKSVTEMYVAPNVGGNTDLTDRLSTLENWAVSIDSKMKLYGQKLSKLDNIEAQIESYSFKHLQQNLIQILTVNTENSDALALKLKSYFDKQYLTKDDMQMMQQEIHERLMNSWKQEMNEDVIRKLIQEYLAVFEKRQMEILVKRVREYVKEVQVHREYVGFDVDAVKKIVAGMLEIFDADKTGMVDFALESAGGQVISTKCTELYQIKTKQYSILGLSVWWVYTSPRYALTPGAMPAECWAFQGFPGYLVVRTYAVIEVTGFSLEHMSKLLAVDGKIESAPKNFSVYGLRDELDTEPHLFGDYMYDENGTSIQYFSVKHPKTENIGGIEYPVAYDIIELRIENNYGNPTYTCVYRFRVHGNPLTDIRRATEDNMKVAET